jgi:hypothetical protein
VPATVAKAAPAAELRTLTYWMTLQRDPTLFPSKPPVQLIREPVVSQGDRVRFAFTSPQAGHLYIFNESPTRAGRPRTFNVLFPSPTSNDGSAALVAGRTLRVPGHSDGFVFDQAAGVETLWFVWSREPQPELDGLKRWANPEDQGVIKAAADVAALDAFLAQHAAPAPEAAVDEVGRTTTVSARADVFVRAIKIEHQ